jgi:hypothetical protein
MVHILGLLPLFVVFMAIVAIGPQRVWRFLKKLMDQKNEGK